MIAPVNDPRPRSVDLRVWRRLFGYVRPYRRELAGLVGGGLLVAGVDICFPLLTERLVNAVAAGEAIDLRAYAVLYVVLTLLLAAGVRAFIVSGGRIRTHVSHDIRRDGFANLQRLSFAYFDRRPVGWLMARMTSDCERLSNILAWGVLDLAWGGAIMLGVTTVMLVKQAFLALFVMLALPMLYLAGVYFKRRILRTAREVRKINARLTGAYNEGITGVRTAKAFVREAEQLGEFQVLSGRMYRASVRNGLLSAAYLPVVLSIGSVATGCVLAAGGMSVLAGGIAVGTLLAFLRYTQFFFEPVQELAHWHAEMQMAQASAERILGLIDEVPAIRDAPHVAAAVARHRGRPGAEDGGPERIGRIEFQQVAFAYAPGEPVLHGFDLSVEEGETVALVGATGGGKSTIVNLLCRFYEPTGGRILLGGVDARERSLGWLHAQLGIVLQQPHLFRGSVRENIRYGRLDATDAEVEAAARLVEADAFLKALPDGYATDVGEGGSLLSTGQRQLVSFARAVLARPQILVMDEATSSVDTETEGRLQRGLARVLAGRTSFVIAHRLSTIRDADRIVVIDRGTIVEQGTHAELLARRGRYQALYVRQRLDDVRWDG